MIDFGCLRRLCFSAAFCNTIPPLHGIAENESQGLKLDVVTPRGNRRPTFAFQASISAKPIAFTDVPRKNGVSPTSATRRRS